MVKDFVNRVFDGAAQPLLLHLATSETLSARERSELKRLIEKTPERGTRRREMPALTLANLILYAAQAALLIGALAALLRGAAACRRPSAWPPAASSSLALLVLPWQALAADAGAGAAGRCRSVGVPPASSTASTPGSRPGLPWGAIVGGVLAAGIVLRLLWLGVGLLRLRGSTRRLPGGRSDR